ncbi:hypothetical protein M885DRAFT_545563 [Pelagophyceae sp. CCMP2097]|nr:hypothetical protein M885DRAFT_545563 [Pelagophyceae sp. CCMP2097]
MPPKKTTLQSPTPEKRASDSLSALRRVDGRVVEVLAAATHTTLYDFADGEWRRTGVEGPLFVVRRSSAPLHRLIVLNRLSMDNLVEGIDETLQVEVVERYLIFRRAGVDEGQKINGMWFHSLEEHANMTALVEELLKKQLEAPRPAALPQSHEALFSMLGLEQQHAATPQRHAPPPPGLCGAAREPELGHALLTPALFVPPKAAVLDVEALRCALRELVEDDAFVAELHARYLRKAGQ